jgi:hypothetical protein
MTGQIILRTTERVSFKRCQQRWWWGWRMGLEPKRTDTKLWFGQGIHAALAEWYKHGVERGVHPVTTWTKWCNDEKHFLKTKGVEPDEPEWVDALTLGANMLYSYVEEYGTDPTWDFAGTEQPVQAKITSPDGVIIYTATFDGVFHDTEHEDSCWLLENKTAASLPNTGYLELDDQASSYLMMAETTLKHQGLLAESDRIDGIMYNFLRKAMPDDRPQDEFGRYLNKNGTVSKNQSTPRFMRYPVWRSDSQRIMQRQHVIDEANQMMAIRNKQQRPTKTPTKDCSRDCAFFQMCQLHESGDDWQEFRDAMFNVRDPYQDHRLALKSA